MLALGRESAVAERLRRLLVSGAASIQAHAGQGP